MQSSFIHRFIHFTHEFMHWKHVWHIDKGVDRWGTNQWMNKCHTNFSYFNKIHVSNVFSIHDFNTWNAQIMIEQILHNLHY
jgi:hypothetical protein